MWGLGVVLLVASAVGFYFMRRDRTELHAMIGAETLPVQQLEMLRSTSDELGGRGNFRKYCEVVGTAHPRPEGLLVSELSKTECVWYRYRVKRHYERVYYRDGRRRVIRGSEVVSDFSSQAGYALRDDQGMLIGVDPNGTKPDQPEQVVSRFEPAHRRGPSLFGIQLPPARGGTIGYEYEEWIIRPGHRLYILGEVHDRIGPLVIGKPQDGSPFIISTRSEQELREHRRKRHRLLSVGVAVGAPAGLIIFVLGLILG